MPASRWILKMGSPRAYTVCMYSTTPQAGQPVPAIASSMYLPLADCSVRAGFPSPAEDFTGKRLDLSAILVEHPQATFVLRVAGTSMVEHGIGDGDMIVVDRSIQARHGTATSLSR